MDSDQLHQTLHEALRAAVAKADNNQSRFAKEIGTSQQLVSYWLRSGKALPGEFVLQAERAGFGSRHDLRPDLYPLDDADPPLPFPSRTRRHRRTAPGRVAA